MCDDDPARIEAQIDQFLQFVNSHLGSIVPKGSGVLRDEPETVSCGDTKHDQHQWWRTMLKWNYVNRLYSLARARQNGLMTPAQLQKHAELLCQTRPVVTQLQALGLTFPQLVLSQLVELTEGPQSN